MSVRELVRDLQKSLSTASDGESLRTIGNKAAALMGNVHAEHLEAEMDFNGLESALLKDHSAAAARVHAKATPEYRRMRIAENAIDELKAIAKATDNALRNLSSEAYLTRG